MRTAEVKVFKASELSDKAKEKAREWFCSLWDSNDAALLAEMFVARLDDAGLSTLKPMWSLSNCQGDGVAFYGFVDLAELAAKNVFVAPLIAALAENVTVEIYRIFGGRYDHWNTMRIRIDGGDAVHAHAEEAFTDALTGVLVALSKQCEKDGYDDIEYRQSMENFLEDAEGNDWEFTENGEKF